MGTTVYHLGKPSRAVILFLASSNSRRGSCAAAGRGAGCPGRTRRAWIPYLPCADTPFAFGSGAGCGLRDSIPGRVAAL